MKIAINCIYFTPKGGGITEYTYNLINELFQLNSKHTFIIYINEESEKSIQSITKNKAILKIFPYTEDQKYRRALFQQTFWKKEEEKEMFDIFHSTFFHAPKFKRAKTILTVHDLRFLNYPKSYKFTRLLYLKYAVKRSIKNADKIISISHFTKQEILKNYAIKQSKIEVIHEAVSHEGFKLTTNFDTQTIKDIQLIKDQFFLSVGHLEPRKNYINLIHAYSALPTSVSKGYPLIIVGKKNHDYKNILEAIDKTEGVIYLDFIAREELIWLYANCKIHVFPSIYEGFGFPTLEAGLFGKPTLGAIQSSIPEIGGEGALYFNPFSVDDIKKCIINILSDSSLYNQISKNAQSNIERFSWKENAKKTMYLYNTFE